MQALSAQGQTPINIPLSQKDSAKSFNLRFLIKKLECLLKHQERLNPPIDLIEKKIIDIKSCQSSFQRIESIQHSNGFYTIFLISPFKTDSYSFDALKSRAHNLLNEIEKQLDSTSVNLLELSDEKLQKLTSINLSNTNYTVEELNIFFSKLHNIKYLNLAGANLDWGKLRLPANCKIVNLSKTSMTADQAASYVQSRPEQDLILNECPKIAMWQHAMIRYTIAAKINQETPDLSFLDSFGGKFREEFLQMIAKLNLSRLKS